MSSTDQEKGSNQHVAFQMKSTEADVEKNEESPLSEDRPVIKNGATNSEEADEERDRLPFLKARQSRFSTTSIPGFPGMASRPSFGGLSSRPSFGGLSFGNMSSRPSMASLRSTISRVNSELYPERGSFVAFSIGHSLADLPTLAHKMYIITQVLAAVSVAMGSMAVGFSAAYTSPALASLDSPNSTLNVTEEQKSWIGSLMPLSVFNGQYCSATTDAVGARDSLRISGESTLERRCSWQPQGTSASSASQETPGGEASATAAVSVSPEGRTPSPQTPQGQGELSLARNTVARSSRRSPLPRYPSAESLTSFAESLVNPGGASSSSLVPAKSTPSLHHHQDGPHAHTFSAKHPSVSAALHASRSTPNLDDSEDGSMVTKKSSMYSYLHGASSSSSSKGGMGGSGVVGGRYWDVTVGADDTPDREDYAHHLRSSSYQLLHSRQLSALSSGSAGSYHSRQHSNTSNYSESEELSPRGDLPTGHSHHHGMDRARFFSYDNLGPESSSQKYHGTWNMSEPDLTLAPPPYSPPGPGYQHQQPPISPTLPSTAAAASSSSPSVKHSPTSPSSSSRHPSSPPPPPVRDASSLKYIKYGPGHEKYPSWPVPAANQVMPHSSSTHDANVSGLPESTSQSSAPQGSHRSKSWTEQSEYPKEKAGGYARPYNKKPLNQSFQRQLKTVMERSEKIPMEVFHNSLREDVFSSSNYSFIDSYYKPSNSYYPLYDRDGRALDDKDYSIPSPPERDLGMGEATLSQVTAAQLEEYVRRYEEFGYSDLIGTTPLLDQLRRESVMWDGRSERDSGRGESESVADSARYSNGRESVTTVVTNSSSASSSETLKWHGSLSDISVMSGHSRDPRSDHNIVHSSRVQAPQRHNSESVLYYGADSRGKPPHGRLGHDSRDHRDVRRSVRDTESGYPRASREGKWSREVERNNEMNNLKKFPSYSYTQPLSQITEAPGAEMRETPKSPTRSPQSPTVDFSKPPSVAERIHELERQSRTTGPESATRWPRDHSGSRERDPRDARDHRDPRDPRDHRDPRDPRDLRDPRDIREGHDPRDPQDLGRRSRDDTSPQEAREGGEKLESRTPREHRESGETRTHQRRGSRDSQRGDRDLRLDFSRTERKGDTSHASLDATRSPSTPGASSSRSPTQKDPDGRPFIHENFQNLLNTFTEVDRVDRIDRSDRMNSNVSYSYLDPEKRRKVPDATLKSIQKQAVMSFYERHTGKSLGCASVSDLSSASSQSSLISSQSAPETSPGKWPGVTHASMNQSMRTDKSGRAGKGMARLGRVPEGEGDDQGHRPARRRSMSGRDSGSEAGTDDLSRGGSQRSSLASDAASSSRGEQPPALPQKQIQVHQEGVTRSSSTSSSHSTSANEEPRPLEEAEHYKDDDISSRTSSSTRGLLDGALASSDTLITHQIDPPRPPSLPPPALDDPPPRPPERPPKKPTLRSLFHGPNPEAAAASSPGGPGAGALLNSPQIEKINSPDSEMRRIEESANELRNMSPARPYYYRKPPAPDPPKSPEATPANSAVAAATTPGSPRPPRSPHPARLHTSPTHARHLAPPISPTSRSSTPDLPPPPPPPVTDGEVVVCDEPLPPPPTPSEVAPPPTDVPPLPPDSPPRERLMGTPLSAPGRPQDTQHPTDLSQGLVHGPS
ncbi:serine/arginine repetitive matrix protein 2-like [Homarus americanus]|uniref:serine/arginine repetitive matrix protein 2-like n=1 Tax=Homarus americanus TaxID=6706 RepID=UPI001C462781|nr:serine/arginine repetitive matrix protein 2-like [Homarus americanus]